MTTNDLEIYCVTNKPVSFIEGTNIFLAGVGKNKFNEEYILSNNGINIYNKETYYSELTFHYWYWKNRLDLKSNKWIGFCQKRRYWVKSDSNISSINKSNILKYVLQEPEEDWNKYDSIICKPIKVNDIKKMKLIKRGWKSLIKSPSIFFDIKKQNIKLHFDMHHGYGNLEKATYLLPKEDINDFLIYIENSTVLNPHIMYISKSKILDTWFRTLFNWLSKCEDIFGFENLRGYDTGRLYAYLAERYASFWFKKYTIYKEQSWAFIDE
ncbi:MAG: DUF4422 domain-containing protein [Candidatus Pelagibacter sp. TMED239]|nr:MAG: DUF4422 domain-containing protein [Candidatus Pelagibacter sp. TMED239]|tara:strand:+ start:5286 stop:6089 length:804 start_codon:yes stop_codon:yes gene_type:complete